MRSILRATVLSALFAAACSSQVGDEEIDSTSDELRATSVIDPGNVGGGIIVGGGGGTGGGGATNALRAVPRVVARSASGSVINITMDRALDPAELPLANIEVLVVRPVGANLVKTNVATSASLSADKKTLRISLNEIVRAGQTYYPRGQWKPCTLLTTGAACRTRPAKFGEILVTSTRVSPWADVLANAAVLTAAPVRSRVAAFNTAVNANLAYESIQLSPSPLQTSVVLAEAPEAAQGNFHIKSFTPGDLAQDVSRTIPWLSVEFEGGTIDCAHTGLGKSAFHLYSDSPDMNVQQSMYQEAPGGTFRGELSCEEDNNRLVFTTPGPLIGASNYKVELNVWSKEGNFMGNKILRFKTKSPGIQVFATRVENHYGGDNTCDNDWFGTNYCDIYVTSAFATSNGGAPNRIPETGDFSGMPAFSSDPVRGKRDLFPERLLYSTPDPVGEAVMLEMWAHDADSDSAWIGILNGAASIAAAITPAVTAINPTAGAISAGTAAGLAGIADLIPSNEDDLLGSIKYNLLGSSQRWGTQSPIPIELQLSKNDPNRGPVKVFLRTEEMPRSWTPPPIIL